MSPSAADWVDRAGQVRDEDRFDVVAVDQWLRQRIDDLPADLPKVKQYAKGASNRTYLLSYGDKKWVMRRPPLGDKAKSAHNMAREYRIQQALSQAGVSVPSMVGLCEDPSVIGQEFYVMSHIEGLILRANLPKSLHLSQARAGEVCRAAIDQLIRLHATPIEGTPLMEIGRGEGYNRRQIEGWIARFEKAKTWNVQNARSVAEWLAEHCPNERALCAIHGDFRLDNLVFHPTLAEASAPVEIKATLDWELATIGDPLMDLGNSMAYWVQADDDFYFRGFRRQPTHLDGMWTRQQVVDYYCSQRGLSSAGWPFYEVYGLFRLAVIVQQIYHRYHHKQTSNPQLKHLWVATNYLLWRCRRVIRRQSSFSLSTS